MSHKNFILQLQKIVGQTGVRLGVDAQNFHYDERNRYHHAPIAVVLPNSVDEVSQVVLCCGAQMPPIALIPQGGNTGLVGGCAVLPDCPSILINLTRLNQVILIDAINQTATVQSGVTLEKLHQAVAQHQLSFPLTLASQNAATIGGNLATNAGGTQVLRYGTMRDLCLGLEVVLADGSIWHGLNTLRKNNTGYDLKNLFIGSEGTLGIITSAVLKLYPEHTQRLVIFIACHSLENIIQAFSSFKQSFDHQLTAFEYISDNALSLVCKQFEMKYPFGEIKDKETTSHTALIELSSTQPLDANSLIHVLGELNDLEVVCHAIVAQNEQQAMGFWRLREFISAAQKRVGRNIKHDISLPISTIAAFSFSTNQALQKAFPNIEPIVFGHIGDGNLHFNISRGLAFVDADELMVHESAINGIVYEQVKQHNGSISAEHGIGLLKRDLLNAVKSPLEIKLMQQIKKQFDPNEIMNPNKVLSKIK